MTTLTIPVSQIRAGDRIHGYPECMAVKRVYNYHGIFNTFPVIEFDNGTTIYPRDMEKVVTIEREKGK